MIGSLFRKARKFLAGESPALKHQQWRDKLVDLYHTLILGFYYYFILTPISFLLRIFNGSFLQRRGAWKRRK